jgi:indole-3-glycerol phosphate synthase
VKKASPSKGIIAEHFPYEEIAVEYEKAGADALSVLTEPTYFKGSDDYLAAIRKKVQIPILRKDFTVDEYMLYEAKKIGADAVLLICAILSPMQLSEYRGIAEELGLSALVEAHDEAEVEMALNAGARIVGVNNRNLKDFTVDINNSVRLRELVPPEVLFVSESGMKTRADIARLEQNGTNAVLIGETFMRSADKAGMLRELAGLR